MTRIGNWLAAPVFATLVALCVAPVLVLVAYSFFQVDFVSINTTPTLKNYLKIAGSETYRNLIARAFMSGVVVVCLTAVIGYPVAKFIAKHGGSWKSALLTLLLVPLYTGDMVRIFAWRVILGAEGVLNRLLIGANLIETPIEAFLFSPIATHIALVYNFLPFMVMGLWLGYEALDDALVEAARDLGARPAAIFRRIILPLTLPGLITGAMMVFVMVVGDHLTAGLLGGASGVTVVSAINDLFGTAFDWPLGSAIACTLLILMTLCCLAAAFALSRMNIGRSLIQGEA